MVMVLGTAAVFYFSGGGIISGEPCSEYDGSIEEKWFQDVDSYGVAYCGPLSEAAWELDAEERFATAQTHAFAVFVMFQLFNVLNCRSADRSIFQLGLFNNKAITISFLISTSFLLFMVEGSMLTIPFTGLQMGDFLSVVPMDTSWWVVIVAVASTVFLVDELRKVLQKSQELRRMR